MTEEILMFVAPTNGPSPVAASRDRTTAAALEFTSGDDAINILIVDDEPKNLTVLETVLDDPGYRLVRAASAEEALLALLVEEFALLILDIRMPGVTGFELAKIIKERRKTARVPIIFLTAYYNEDQHVLEGYDSGAVDYLHKPVNPAILRSKVAVFAELHRKSREVANANRALLAEVTERRRVEQRLHELNDTLEQRVTERTAALGESEENLRFALRAANAGAWNWDIQTGSIAWSPGNYALYDIDPAQGPLHYQDWESRVHPEDRECTKQAVRAAVENPEVECRVEFRVVDRQGETRWLLGLGRVEQAVAGRVVRMSGINLDITQRKQAEEHTQLLMAEINHRAKNLLAVVQAVANQTARDGEPATFVHRLTDRISGLAASQNLLVESQWRGVEISDLIRAQLAHFSDLLGTRVLVDGPSGRLTPTAAQAIGMALHEMGTNAAKYGALSNVVGRVRIFWQITVAAEPTFTMNWREEDGPKVSRPTRIGFGGMVIGRAVEAAVDGAVEFDYPKSGFTWKLAAPAARALVCAQGEGDNASI